MYFLALFILTFFDALVNPL